MKSNNLIRLITQLDFELKELIAITDKYILVKWLADNSYVSWEYYEVEGRFVFERGHYMRCENSTPEAVLAAFSERIK